MHDSQDSVATEEASAAASIEQTLPVTQSTSSSSSPSESLRVAPQQRLAAEAPSDRKTTAEPPTGGEAPQLETKAAAPQAPDPKQAPSTPAKGPAIILAVIIASVAALSIWYLMRPEPLLLQGEVDATRLDIAARVDGRVADVPVERGQ